MMSCCTISTTTRNDIIVMVYISYEPGVYTNNLPLTSVIGSLLLDIPLTFGSVYLAGSFSDLGLG